MLEQSNPPIDTLSTKDVKPVAIKDNTNPVIPTAQDTLTKDSVEKVAIKPNNITPKPSGYFSLDTKDYESYTKNGVYATSYMDEQRARLQPWSEQLGNSLPKMLGTTATTFAETFTDGIGLLVYGLAKATSTPMKFSDVYNNKITQFYDNINSTLEKKFPNYYTQQEQDNTILQDMFGSGAANFWGDKFIKNIGFTVGAIGAGIVTAGIGDWALGISRGSKVAAALLEGEKTLENANRLYQAGKLTREALNTFKNSYNYLKTANAINVSVSTFASASAEAFIEGRNGINDYTNGKIEEYKKNYGSEPTPDIIDKYKEEGESLGNIRWALNMPILMGSNVIQFGKMFSRGFTKDATNLAKQRFIETSTGKTLAEVTDKELLTGTFRYEVPKIANLLRTVKYPLIEGFQEIEQFHIEKTLANYFNKKYDLNGREQSANFINSLTEGFKEAYGTKEGWEQAIIGGLTGMLGIPNLHGIQNRIKGRIGDKSIMSGGIWEGIAQNNRDNITNQRIVDILNDPNEIKKTITSFDNFNTFLSSQQEYSQALAKGDHFVAENAQYDDFASHIVTNLENESFDLYKSKLNAIGRLSNEEFATVFDRPNITDAQRLELINSISTKADNIKKYWDMTNTRFSDINSVARIGPEETLNLKHLFVIAASNIDDIDARETSIANKISSISKGKFNYSDIQNIRGKFTDTDTLTNKLLNTIDDKETKQQVAKVIKEVIKDLREKSESIPSQLVANHIKGKVRQDIENKYLNDIITIADNIKAKEYEQGEFRKESEKRLKDLKESNPQVASQITALLEDVSKLKDRRKEFIDLYNFLDKGIQSDTIEDLAVIVDKIKTNVINDNYARQQEEAKKAKAERDRINNETIAITEKEKEVTTIQRLVNKGKEKLTNIIKPTKTEATLEDLLIKANSEHLEYGESVALSKMLTEQEVELRKDVSFIDNDGNKRTQDALTLTNEEKKDYLTDIIGIIENVDKQISTITEDKNSINREKNQDKLDKLNATKIYLENHYESIRDTRTSEELTGNIVDKNKEIDNEAREWMQQLSPDIEVSVIEKARNSTNKLFDLFEKLKDRLDINNFESFAKYLNSIDSDLFKEKYIKISGLYQGAINIPVNLSYEEIMKKIAPNVKPKLIDEGGSKERNNLIIKAVHIASNLIVGDKMEDSSDIDRQYNRSEIGYNLIAYLSRSYYQVNDLFKGTSNRIDMDNTLLNSEPVLDPTYLKPNDKITLEVQSRDEFKPFTKNNKLYTYDDVVKNINTIPIVIKKNGNNIGFLHTTDWLNNDSLYGMDKDIQDQKDTLQKIREYVFNNGIVNTTISERTLGYLIRQSNNKISKVKDAFSNPNLEIAIIKDGNFNITTTRPYSNKYPNKTILNKSSKEGSELVEGGTYLMLDLGTDNIIGIPVLNNKLDLNATKSISSAIRAFVTKDKETLSKLDKSGFELSATVTELERFVGQFVYNFNNVNRIGEGKDLYHYLSVLSKDSNEARLSINNYNIQFGKGQGIGLHEIQFDKNGIVSIKIGSTNYNKNNTLFNEKVEEVFKALEILLPQMYGKTDITKLNTNTKVIGLEDNNPVVLYNNYNDFIKDTTSTNLKDFEYTNPITKETKYINTIQSKITIDTNFINKKEITSPIYEIAPPPIDAVIPESKIIEDKLNLDDVTINIPTEQGGQIEVFYKGNKVEFTNFGLLIDNDIAFVGKVEKKDQTTLKGIGTLAYIKLGIELANRNITLTSSDALYAKGNELWTRLVKLGYAKKQGVSYVFTLPTTIEKVPITQKSIISPLGTQIVENNINFGEEDYSPDIDIDQASSTHLPLWETMSRSIDTVNESKDLRLRC